MFGIKTVLSADATGQFALKYNRIHIGTLSFADGMWHFSYEDAFADQQELLPLMDFPNIQRKYTSAYLWPFFVQRIPGLKQPAVQRILKAENISATDTLALLSRFGRNCISNPYILIPQQG